MTPRKSSTRGTPKSTPPPGVIDLINTWVAAGKNILWLGTIIVVITLKFSSIDTQLEKTKDATAALDEKIQNKNNELAEKQKEVAIKLAAIEEKQTEQLVILTKLTTMFSASGLQSGQISQPFQAARSTKNGNRSTSNNR